MRIHKLAAAALSALLTTALVVGMLPLSAAAASSAEIQKDIDALKAKNKEIQKQIDGVQSQYNANMDDMKSIVAQKSAVDQEIALLSNKIAATNEQIVAYGRSGRGQRRPANPQRGAPSADSGDGGGR